MYYINVQAFNNNQYNNFPAEMQPQQVPMGWPYASSTNPLNFQSADGLHPKMFSSPTSYKTNPLGANLYRLLRKPFPYLSPCMGRLRLQSTKMLPKGALEHHAGGECFAP